MRARNRLPELLILLLLTDFLKKTDRFAKTIVFCVDQEHASEMRAALVKLNADLVAQHPDYVARVTADEGAMVAAISPAFKTWKPEPPSSSPPPRC